MTKFLIVRTDRMGDVLLTTPVSSALRKQFPDSQIHWLVRSYTAPLLENNPDVDRVIIDDGAPVASLVSRLRQEAYDVAIIAYPRFRVAWATWLAGIPKRIGPASKWYSLFFSDKLWQHRSRGEEHEADFNLKLLAPLGVPFKRFPTTLVLSSDERQRAKNALDGLRVSFQKPVVFLHPGSGGSAARWPLVSFMELGDRLQEAGCDVVVTGGPGENYQYRMIDNMRRIPLFIAAGSVSVRELAALFSWGDLLVSNSTGPLHLAVALDVPTVSIFSALKTCHPKRWGPYPGFVEGSERHGVEVAPLIGDESDDISAVSVERIESMCRQKLGREAQAAIPVKRN